MSLMNTGRVDNICIVPLFSRLIYVEFDRIVKKCLKKPCQYLLLLVLLREASGTKFVSA